MKCSSEIYILLSYIRYLVFVMPNILPEINLSIINILFVDYQPITTYLSEIWSQPK